MLPLPPLRPARRRKVKVTPTFIIFRDGDKVHQHGGINETNLHRVSGCCLSALTASCCNVLASVRCSVRLCSCCACAAVAYLVLSAACQ